MAHNRKFVIGCETLTMAKMRPAKAVAKAATDAFRNAAIIALRHAGEKYDLPVEWLETSFEPTDGLRVRCAYQRTG